MSSTRVLGVVVFGAGLLLAACSTPPAMTPSPAVSCELPNIVEVGANGVIPATPYPAEATVIANEGSVCFYPTPDSSFNVGLSASGCHASGCTIVYERTGDMVVDLETHTIQFYSRFVVQDAMSYWGPGAGGQCGCAADCGGAGDLRFDTPRLPDGLYRVRLGDMQIGELRVPYSALDSCLESWQTATPIPPTRMPTPTRDPAAYPLPSPYPAPATGYP
jgi:hypothetical protein